MKHYRFRGAYCTEVQYKRLMKGAAKRKEEARKGIPHVVTMKAKPARNFYI